MQSHTIVPVTLKEARTGIGRIEEHKIMHYRKLLKCLHQHPVGCSGNKKGIYISEVMPFRTDEYRTCEIRDRMGWVLRQDEQR